ncbi:hypothetical protein BGZ94_002767 [Podila epigama]|nr:hypothetical protein BGZ94_002767 [Podila epigama]
MCNDTVAAEELCDYFCGFLYEDGHAKGLEKGLAQGYSKGYNTGFQKGSDAGYARGYDAGFRLGTDEGFAKGIETGLRKGRDEGHAKGFAAGFKSGHDKGYNKGLYDADMPISYLLNNQVLVVENALFCILLLYYWMTIRRRKGYESLQNNTSQCTHSDSRTHVLTLTTQESERK